MAARNLLISVVVPLYNKQAEIQRCLDSIAAQTVGPDEVLVVDDGSTDGSRAIVAAAVLPGLRLISQPNQGECVARNTGILAAKGSLIAFLDADDEWHPDFLAEIARLRRAYPEAGAYGTAYAINKGRFGRYNVVCDVHSEHVLLLPDGGSIDYFDASAAMTSSSTAVWRDVFDTVGLFRPGIRQGGDLDMWFRIGCVYPIAYSKKSRAVWHWTPLNRSTGLCPNEEDFVGTSLRDLTERGLVGERVLPKAQKYLRRLNLRRARDLANYDRGKGLQALRAWKTKHGASPRWYLHYIPLMWFPKSYWTTLRSGAWVKGLIRTLVTVLREGAGAHRYAN